MTILSKIAGGLSLASCLYDTHKTAVIKSNNAYAKASSNATIEKSIGNQKMDRMSYRDAERKNWLAESNFGIFLKEIAGKVGGYCKGIAGGLVRYSPNIILSSIAILSGAGLKNIQDVDKLAKATKRHNIVATVATVGLAGLELFDFIKNSTNMFQKTDYLE